MTKKIVCPGCKAELEFLRNIQSGEYSYDFYLSKGEVEYESNEFYEDGRINTWNCPECDKVIAGNEKEAKLFLEGKLVKK